MTESGLVPEKMLGDKLPVYLPLGDVSLLEEICKAADVEGGADGYIAGLLGHSIESGLQSTPGKGKQFAAGLDGICLDIFDGYKLTNPRKAVAGMLKVVKRWNAKEKGKA